MNYEVQVSRKTVVEEAATIYLDADNEEDAEQLALELIKNDDAGECFDSVDWEPLSRKPGEAEVDGISENGPRVFHI